MRIFLLARHGESLYNVGGIVNGDPARDRGLSERGEAEARALGVQLSGVDLDLVVTSQFPRAQETAAIALAGRDVPHVVLEDLNDIRIGELDGKTLADYRAWKRGHTRSDRFPGGESLDEAAVRYARAYRDVVAHQGDVLLVVCHEIPIRYAVNAAAGSGQLDGPTHDIENAVPYAFGDRQLAAAADGIERLAVSVA